MKVSVPIIVRLTGTNADLGQKLLSDYALKNKTLKMHVVNSFDKAAD